MCVLIRSSAAEYLSHCPKLAYNPSLRRMGIDLRQKAQVAHWLDRSASRGAGILLAARSYETVMANYNDPFGAPFALQRHSMLVMTATGWAKAQRELAAIHQ
jgi:hypothetical protein